MTVSLAQLAAALSPKTRIRAKNVKRSDAAYAFAYHSTERVEWVKARPCAWCRLRGLIRIPRPSDNAHTGKPPGKGLKAHYSTIVELCRRHHTQYDDHLAPFDKPSARHCVEKLAEATERAWQLSQGNRDV